MIYYLLLLFCNNHKLLKIIIYNFEILNYNYPENNNLFTKKKQCYLKNILENDKTEID